MIIITKQDAQKRLGNKYTRCSNCNYDVVDYLEIFIAPDVGWPPLHICFDCGNKLAKELTRYNIGVVK